MNVRRLAALDMHGTRDAKRRRRIIRAEFITGAVVMAASGAWLAASSAGLGGRALGLCIIGCGLNYAPLAAHAMFTAAMIRFSARGPAAAISFSVRHAVGTDATRPNSSP